MEMTFITYTGSFKYKEPIFLDKSKKQMREMATTPPLPQDRVVIFVLKWPASMIPELAVVI